MLEINLTKNTNEVLNGTLGKYYGREMRRALR